MGQCIYVADSLGPGKPGPIVVEIPSKLWMHPDEAGRRLGKDHLLNTTLGVWLCDERHVWDKRLERAAKLSKGKARASRHARKASKK